MKYSDNLTNLRTQPWFQSHLKENVFPACPQITPYHIGRVGSEWEYESGLREGYILALRKFGVKFSE